MRQRILRATTASLSWQPQDADGEPVDPGTVTVGVTRSDGSELIAAGTATVAVTPTGPRTVALTVAQTVDLDWLTATWKVGGDTVATTVHEIVGGYYFTLAELRGQEPSTADASRDTTDAAKRCRAEVEALIESSCGVAFVPRFEVVRLPVIGRLAVLPMAQIRRIRWARTWASGIATAVDDDTVAAIAGGVSGVLALGVTGDVEVGVEHGYDAPPPDLKRASITAARAQLNMSRSSSAIDRATSMQMGDGTSITLATPGVGQWHTGIPAVDEVLRRYNHRAVVA